jgi:hypothetical protein
MRNCSNIGGVLVLYEEIKVFVDKVIKEMFLLHKHAIIVKKMKATRLRCGVGWGGFHYEKTDWLERNCACYKLDIYRTHLRNSI